MSSRLVAADRLADRLAEARAELLTAQSRVRWLREIIEALENLLALPASITGLSDDNSR